MNFDPIRSIEIDNLLPDLAERLKFDLVAFVSSDPLAFVRMASTLDSSISSPLDPPSEWDKVLDLYQSSPEEVTQEEWDEYHAARRAFETPYWPPQVKDSILLWVAAQNNGKLLGVRLNLHEMNLEKEELS